MSDPTDPDLLDEAERMEPGRRYRRATGARYIFQLPADWMTVSLLLHSPSQIDRAYPAYLLESSDGAYQKRLNAKDDLVCGEHYYELRFEKLLAGRTYKLTRWLDVHVMEVVFEGLDFMEIVDQPRAVHQVLDNHGYLGRLLDDDDDDPAEED